MVLIIVLIKKKKKMVDLIIFVQLLALNFLLYHNVVLYAALYLKQRQDNVDIDNLNQ